MILASRNPERTFRVLLIGSHEMLMAFLADHLRRDGRFCILGIAPSPTTALQMVSERPVDVVLLDLDFGGASCFESASMIHGLRPSVRLLFTASVLTDSLIKQALSVGVSGLLPKHDLPQSVISALLDALAGGVSFPAAVVSRLVVDRTGNLRLEPALASLA